MGWCDHQLETTCSRGSWKGSPGVHRGPPVLRKWVSGWCGRCRTRQVGSGATAENSKASFPPLRASPEPARFRFLSGVNPCEKEMRCEAQSQRVSQCPAHARFCGGAMTALLAACWSTCFLRREKEGARHVGGASSGGRPP